jgi:hypothetical protein
MRPIKRFFKKLKRVIDFLPIIWNGHDFDYHYAIQLFKYQLQRTADMFDSRDAVALDSKMNAQKIRTAIRLMDKVYEDEYVNEYMDIIDQVYGKTEWHFTPVEGREGSVRVTMTNPMAVNEEHQQQIDRTRYLLAEVSRDKHDRAHKLLWDFVEHNIQRWWD